MITGAVIFALGCIMGGIMVLCGYGVGNGPKNC